jgi:hypothetical protein
LAWVANSTTLIYGTRDVPSIGLIAAGDAVCNGIHPYLEHGEHSLTDR